MWLSVLNDFVNEATVMISYTFFLWSLMAILDETKNRRQCLKWFGICLVFGCLLKCIASLASNTFCTSRVWIFLRMVLNFSIILYVGIGQWVSNYTLSKIKGYVDDNMHNEYIQTDSSAASESTTRMQSLNVKFMISQIF